MKISNRTPAARWQILACFVSTMVAIRGLAATTDASEPSKESSANPPQIATTKGESNAPSRDSVAARLKELDFAPDDTPDKAKLIELYRTAAEDLRQADEQAARLADFEKKLSNADARIETLNCESGEPTSVEQPLAPLAPLSAWEQRLADVEQRLTESRKTLAAKKDEPQRRGRRRLEIPPAIATARTALEKLISDGETANSDEPSSLAKARRVQREARRKSLELEVTALEKELRWYDGPAAEVLRLEGEEAARKVAALDGFAAELREAVNSRRREEAAKQAADARRAVVTADSSVRRLADKNSELANERKQLAEKLEQLGGMAETVRIALDNLRSEHKRIVEKVEAAGLTNPVGQMLRKQRSGLASVVAHRRAIDQRRDEISAVQWKLFDLEEQLADFRDLRSRAREICDQSPAACPIGPDDLVPLLTTRKEYLESLRGDYDVYFRKLVEVDSDQRVLVQEAADYRNFIDERVLWIRSVEPLSPVDVKKSVGAIGWLANPQNWWNAAQSALYEADEEPILAGLAVAALAFVLFTRRRLKQAIRSLGSPAAEFSGNAHASIRRALKAALATLLISIPTPALLWMLGWFVSGGSHIRDEFSEALGDSLQVTAVVLLPLLVARQICRRDGLAEAHFGWPAEALAALRRQVSWLAMLGAPVVAMVALLEAQANEAWSESFGRALFLVSQGLLAVFLFRSLQPPHGALHRLLVMRAGSWLDRLSTPLYFVLLAIPMVVGGLAAAGYYYTALRLAWRLELTLWLVMGLVVGQSLLRRWLTAVYRRCAIESAVRLVGDAGTAGRPAETLDAAAEAPSEVDLEKVDVQTERLLHSITVTALVFGLGWVWSEVLPALQIFNQVTLLHDSRGMALLTLANMLNAAIAVALTVVAVHNLPGLLEAAILHRLPLDAGVRYAVAAVLRYAIGIAGVTVAAGFVGIGWPKVQWLVAAVTFGLGFGLQEIFANFVSGLIVLFERPVRVGDTVTVGEITGTVSRIHMRATTITDGDRKELIVPNKEFITARLVNWTLSDPVSRIMIPIGIAYGSDTEQVQRLLLKVARTTPHVLREPPAGAFFMGFGESALNFELRAFVAHVEHRMNVLHELNTRIDRAFREAGIEIAFPQRDLRIRPIAGLPSADSLLAPSLTSQKNSADRSRNAA
ncbi:MAG: mechanosensitive ion channel [Pirellulales bacterium]|nr:mechanosensitive ion channel [Pirellulales bacterium]